jgi:Ni,Fe-hydrogenase III small subunit
MKVKELKALLDAMDPEANVVVATGACAVRRISEANAFREEDLVDGWKPAVMPHAEGCDTVVVLE